MARKSSRKRKIKFSPFRMSKRFEKAMMVGLGVFLMVIFAVPFAGPCRQTVIWGHDPQAVLARIGDRTVTYAEAYDLAMRQHAVFPQFSSRDEDVKERALIEMAYIYEAERAGVHISNEQVADYIRTQFLPRRVRAEWVIAENKSLPGPAAAKAALAKLKAEVDAIEGEMLNGAFKRLAARDKLGYGDSDLFTSLTADNALSRIIEAPNVAQRAFTQPIGQSSEVLPLSDGWCIFRVVERTRGFGPDGRFHSDEEGWVRAGYGVRSYKVYEDELRDRRVSQPELEQAIRERLVLPVRYGNQMVNPGIPGNYVLAACVQLPASVVRNRYHRNNTRAVPAYFAVQATDFLGSVTYTPDELRTFYVQHMEQERADLTPGYRQPPRVKIQYLLGLKSKVSETDLNRIITSIAVDAATQADKGESIDFGKLAEEANAEAPGAFEVAVTPLFAASEADRLVPQLEEAKPPLSQLLFGKSGEAYAIAGTMPAQGAHALSSVLSCKAGLFFFQMLERVPGRAIPYDEITPTIRQQLVSDYMRREALLASQRKAGDYRALIQKGAFDRFAAHVAAKPVETKDFLTPESPLPGVDKAVPAIYDALVLGERGDLSSVVAVGDQFVLARLVEHEAEKGLRLEVLAFTEKQFKGPLEPSDYELQARYDQSPYPFLEKPEPVPFEKVEADIRKLLAHRAALARATELAEAARKQFAEAQAPDLAAAAAKHNLTLKPGIKVDLAKTEATSLIGKAGGFHDAVTGPALKPGQAGPILSSAEGRFLFVLRESTAQAATIDVASILFDEAAKQAKVDDKEVRKYYDENRDLAYVIKDEIKEAPSWEQLPEAARQQVSQGMQDEWAKKPVLQRLGELRNSLVLAAFATAPTTSPLKITRDVTLIVPPTVEFPVSKPPEALKSPGVIDAVKALKPGELSKPLATKDGALLVLLVGTKPDDVLEADYVMLNRRSFMVYNEEFPAAELKAYYEAHKDSFRRVKVELLGVAYKEKVRADVEKLLDEAAKALRAEGKKADFAAYAKSHTPLEVQESRLFRSDAEAFILVGFLSELAAQAFAAKDGEIVGPVYGELGAALFRRLETKEPSFEEARFDVGRDMERERAAERALAAAKTLHERVAAALAKAEEPDQRPEAFRKAVETEPVKVELPYPVTPVLSAPIYPLQEDQRKNSQLTGLGPNPELVRAVFQLQPGQLSPVVQDPRQETSYVAALAILLPAPEPSMFDLLTARYYLQQESAYWADLSWDAYVRGQIQMAR